MLRVPATGVKVRAQPGHSQGKRVGRCLREGRTRSPDRRVEILSSHDSLHATWSRFGPGRDGADLHVHREHTDLFYVLEGEFTLRLGPQGEACA